MSKQNNNNIDPNINLNPNIVIKVDLEQWEDDYHIITFQDTNSSYVSNTSTNTSTDTSTDASNITQSNNTLKNNILFVCLLFCCIMSTPILDFYFAFFSNQSNDCYNEIQTMPEITLRVWLIVQATSTILKYCIICLIFLPKIQLNFTAVVVYIHQIKQMLQTQVVPYTLYFIIFMFSCVWTAFGVALLSDTNNISITCQNNINGYLISRVCISVMFRMIELSFIIEAFCGCPI